MVCGDHPQISGGIKGRFYMQDKDSQTLRCVRGGQKATKRGPSGLSLFRSDSSHDGQARKLDCHEAVAKDTQI